MRLRIIGNLITNAGHQSRSALVYKLGLQFAFNTEHDVAFDASVISEIARCVLDHTYAHAIESSGAPIRYNDLALVLDGFNLCPASGTEWDIGYLHDGGP